MAHLHAREGIEPGRGLSGKPQEHLADINRREYWADPRFAGRANEPGSEVGLSNIPIHPQTCSCRQTRLTPGDLATAASPAGRDIPLNLFSASLTLESESGKWVRQAVTGSWAC